MPFDNVLVYVGQAMLLGVVVLQLFKPEYGVQYLYGLGVMYVF